MISRRALRQAGRVLDRRWLPEANLGSELLLRHTLRIDRAGLYQDPDRELSVEEESAFRRLLKRRLRGEPVAYILGRREFYGLDFEVDRRVLIPRPDTELLVDKALAFARRHDVTEIADIGTGSGAVAVALAVNLPGVTVYATDISAAALEVARRNASRHGVGDRIRFLAGDLLAPLPPAVPLIIANLPYVTAAEVEDGRLADFEPELALSGGTDGLDVIRRLVSGLPDKLRPGGCLLLEVGWQQGRQVAALLRKLYPGADVEITPDLGGIDRVVGLTLNRV
jgi:release factor glutamine methyltransferase